MQLEHQYHSTYPAWRSEVARRRHHVALALVAIGSSVGVAIAALQPALLMLLIAPGVLLLIRRSLGPLWLSPLAIVVAVITAVGFLGYIFYNGRTTPYANQLFTVSHGTAVATVEIIAVSMTAMAVGAYGVLLIRPRHGATPARMVAGHRARVALVGITALSFALALANVTDLLSRHAYITATSGSVGGALPLVTAAALAALGYLTATTSGGARSLVVAASIVEFIVLFSTGSRDFALAPITFAAGLHVGEGSPRTRLALGASVIIGLLLLPVPLFMRAQSSHGLVPYSAALADMPYSLSVVKNALANLLLGFPVTGITGTQTTQVTPHDLFVSVNPEPGGTAGWYKISQYLRLSYYYPYAGLGEAWSVSPLYSIAIFGCIGAWLGYLEGRIGTLLERRQQVFALALVALCALFSLLVTSYNLRNATRPLWYSVGLSIILALIHMARRPGAPEAHSREHVSVR